MGRHLSTVLGGLALLAAGCGDEVLTGPSEVTGAAWQLRNMQLADYSVLEIPQPDRYTVEFQEGGQLAARADCNGCAASYEISGETLRIGPLACTRAYCGEDSLDSQYQAILGAAGSHGVRDGVLTLSSPQGVLRYTR